MSVVSVAGTKPAVQSTSVVVNWDKVFGRIDIDDVKAHGVSDDAVKLLLEGSKDLAPIDVMVAVATELLAAGLSGEECAEVLLDPSHVGNKYVIDKTTIKQQRTAVTKVLNKAAALLAREHATAAGIPLWRDTSDDAKLFPYPSLANAVIGIKALGVTCKYDLFHDTVLVGYDGAEATVANLIGEVNDKALKRIRSIINNKYRLELTKEYVKDGVEEIAFDHAFDPVLDYLTQCEGKWDGVPRLDTWTTRYLGVEDTPLNRAIGVCALVGSVRRARVPGCKLDYIFVLEGPEGTDKSTVIATLAGRENFSDQTILGADDKVVQEHLRGVWLFECADLTGINRAGVDHVKAFASRFEDRARRAWGTMVEKQPRRCSIWATTNNERYLVSQTGNRRFLPLATTVIDLAALKLDRDQLWAEAALREAEQPRHIDDKSHMLPREFWKLAAEAQEARRVVDPWEDTLAVMPDATNENDKTVRIIHHGHDDDGKPVQRVRSDDILAYVLKLPASQRTSAAGKRVATVMGKLGWQRSKSGTLKIDGHSVRGYWRPVAAERMI